MSSIQVALFDKSPIIKKMLSHCLHYFATDIQSFSTLQEFLIESQKKEQPTKKISAIFVDWEMQQDDQPLFYHLQKQFKEIPLVLLYRSSFLPQVKDLSKDQVPYRIQKPINPKEVRDLFGQLIPQAKKSPIHSFLQFPKTELEKKQELIQKDGNLQSVPFPTNQGASAVSKKSLIGGTIEKTLTEVKKLIQKSTEETKSSVDTLSHQTTTVTSKSKTEESKTLSQKKPDQKGIELKAPPAKPNLESKNLSANTQAKPPEPSSVKEQASSTTVGKAIDKDNLGLNEDTKNDLAPMAIKSSFDTKSQKSGFENEDQVVAFFEKYKDSLQFQKILEKVLKAEIKNVIQKLLNGAEVSSLLKEPLQDFKEGHQFKQWVEKEISAYVQKELPLVIKSCVQQEIKKIIG